MTQVKLWQIVSQTPNAIIFTDADGNLVTLPAASANQVLVAGPNGEPVWADNTALQTALQAQTDAASALASAKAFTEAQIAALVGGAPLALDTLNELAQKLTSEESALNALIAQVETKASKTEVSTQIAQAKDEAATAATAYTNAAVSASAGNLTASIQQARNEAIIAAGNNATDLANAAQSAAIIEANAYTDQQLANASSTLSGDAETKVNALRDSIPSSFVVEGTSTACFVASSSALDPQLATSTGLLVGEHFSEVTGAVIASDDSSMKAKLLFINGVAMADDWAVPFSADGQLRVQMTQALADHVFDGTENSVMVLVEYKSINAITVKP